MPHSTRSLARRLRQWFAPARPTAPIRKARLACTRLEARDVPAAFTPGCTIEAHEFAEATPAFNRMGATVIGMSADPIDKLNKFSVEECRNKFAVGSATPAIVTGYDVPLKMKAGLTDRTSYVIGKNGRIVFVHSAMSPAGHVTGTMDAVKAWRAKHPLKG